MGIYKRKQESKKTRKHAFDQESDQEKKEKLSFFLVHFLGRVLVFLFSFINSHLWSALSVSLSHLQPKKILYTRINLPMIE